jgi:hypothetical protein
MNNISDNNCNNNNYIVTRSIIFSDTEGMLDNITSMDEENSSSIQTKEEANKAHHITLTQMWQNIPGSENEKVRYPNIP